MSSGLVESCLQKVTNHFELVVLVACRAQEISSGAASPRSNTGRKPFLVALEEMAHGNTDLPALENNIVTSFRQYAFLDKEQEKSPAQEE